MIGRSTFFISLCIALGPSLLLAQAPSSVPPVQTSSVPAAPQSLLPEDARFQALLAHLASDDFAQREAAQKELDALTWRDLATIRRLAQSATEEEAKARLAARLAALEEQIATNPPPITLDLKDATFSEVVESLNKSLGVSFSTLNLGRNDVTYSITAHDRPFWEVFSELSRQHGLQIQGIGGDLRLLQSTPGWRTPVIAGPIAVLPETITRTKTIQFQQDPQNLQPPEQMRLMCRIGIDPRVRIVKFVNPFFTSIVDDAGNSLLQPVNPALAGQFVDGRNIGFLTYGVPLQIAEKKATRIVSAKGQLRFIAEIASIQTQFAEVDKKAGQSFNIGDRKITLSSFELHDNILRVALQVQNPGPPGLGGPVEVMESEPSVRITLQDSTGKQVWSSTITGATSFATSGGQFTPPFKMLASLPTKTKDITIFFELKDLTLP